MYNTVNESEWTVYVMPITNKILLAKTEELKRIAQQHGKEVETETSKGWVLPITYAETLANAKTYEAGQEVANNLPTTSARARESERVLKQWAENRGYEVTLHDDLEHQLRGVDATLTATRKLTVQIKYDGRAADTKNIYVEYAEENPTKAH